MSVRRSPHLNVMVDAAEKAGRSLIRDFGEVENLQVSRKGPGDFVSNADTKAEKIVREVLEKGRPNYSFLFEDAEVDFDLGLLRAFVQVLRLRRARQHQQESRASQK